MIPAASVSAVGALTTGPSCGPASRPCVATNGSPAPSRGISTMGGPSTIAATVEPVGAMRSDR
jgi:hypothetical protein